MHSSNHNGNNKKLFLIACIISSSLCYLTRNVFRETLYTQCLSVQSCKTRMEVRPTWVLEVPSLYVQKKQETACDQAFQTLQTRCLLITCHSTRKLWVNSPLLGKAYNNTWQQQMSIVRQWTCSPWGPTQGYIRRDTVRKTTRSRVGYPVSGGITGPPCPWGI
jgi:hypothetical protein